MQKNFIFPFAIFIAGLCSIIYELQISTASSYFLGDSVKQFSLTIGVYMAAMGLGSYLSRYFHDPLLVAFVAIEILLGIVGGCSIPLSYWAFDKIDHTQFQWMMLGLTLLIGVLTGLEIPLLSRIMKDEYSFEDNLSNVLSLDYFGALIATLLFPFLLLPSLGVFRVSVLFGLINILLGFIVAIWCRKGFKKHTRTWLEMMAFVPGICFAGLLYFAKPILATWQDNAFSHKVVYAQQTPYQHLALTKNRHDIRLYINRIIQFSSTDEYRYHESLALLPVEMAPYKADILVLGGGEGLLARELLKYEAVKSVTIIDLDPTVFALAKENQLVRQVNKDALLDPRVHAIAQDAAVYLDTVHQTFDIIIADLPDPSNEAVARLYSTFFYKKVMRSLRPNGVFATQGSSPFHTNKAYWCIAETMKSAGFLHIKTAHTFVPSFGDWGFVFGSQRDLPLKTPRVPTKYLDSTIVQRMQYFEQDLRNPSNLQPNTLDKPALLDYYLEDWSNWSREKLNLGDGK
jgi:spermidine synthase